MFEGEKQNERSRTVRIDKGSSFVQDYKEGLIKGLTRELENSDEFTFISLKQEEITCGSNISSLSGVMDMFEGFDHWLETAFKEVLKACSWKDLVALKSYARKYSGESLGERYIFSKMTDAMLEVSKEYEQEKGERSI